MRGLSISVLLLSPGIHNGIYSGGCSIWPSVLLTSYAMDGMDGGAHQQPRGKVSKRRSEPVFLFCLFMFRDIFGNQFAFIA